jgi:hypothetical protein
MRPATLFLFAVISAPTGVYAQGQTPQAPQAPPRQVYVQDGGVSERLESIVVPPKAHAPFSSTLQTEWVRALSDGGSITLVNERRIARDGNGRIYQERWLLVPKNGKQQSVMTTVQISDPNNHTHYNCFTHNHVCELSDYGGTTSMVFKVEGPPTGPLPDDAGFAMHEDLGKQLVSGVDAVGTRESTIYNPGVFGNDRKLTVAREFWYSPQLAINLISKRSDPRFGTQTFTVTNLILSEPDQHLFDVPEGFAVTDLREPGQPAAPPAAN